jgi:hypothetical protein
MNFNVKVPKSIVIGVLVGSAFYAGSNLNANTNANTNNNTVICAPPIAANPQPKAEISVLSKG